MRWWYVIPYMLASTVKSVHSLPFLTLADHLYFTFHLWWNLLYIIGNQVSIFIFFYRDVSSENILILSQDNNLSEASRVGALSPRQISIYSFSCHTAFSTEWAVLWTRSRNFLFHTDISNRKITSTQSTLSQTICIGEVSTETFHQQQRDFGTF